MTARFSTCFTLILVTVLAARIAGAEPTFLLNQRSGKYHQPDCTGAKSCKNCIEITIEEAKARHAVPCQACIGRTEAPPRDGAGRRGTTLFIDGVEVPVHWIDGDTFKRRDRPNDRGVRVVGYNTLESYGPVHRWGTWSPRELWAVAKQASLAAAATPHRCTSIPQLDSYGRGLTRCPTLARALVGQGLAMVFAVDGEPEPELVRAQAAARNRRLGMWAKGVPARIVTSLHSADEVRQGREPAGRTYNRVVDTRTGASRALPHASVYRACTEVCEGGGADRTCMVYVPYEDRYGRDRAACLR